MSIIVRKRLRRRDFRARFWAKVRKTKTCWLFPCSPNRDGYGRIRIDYKLRKANRVAWELQVGPIPDGMQVLHTCDNRLCVRRSHLFLGTSLDNNKDCVSKKRHGFGSRNGRAKLDEFKVIEIRRRIQAGETCKSLAKEFKVSPTRIGEAANKITWRHLA